MIGKIVEKYLFITNTMPVFFYVPHDASEKRCQVLNPHGMGRVTVSTTVLLVGIFPAPLSTWKCITPGSLLKLPPVEVE